MKHLFIDTNRYLSLYGFPKEELDKIGKIVELIEKKEIELYLPQQVEEEFKRKREEHLVEILCRTNRIIKNIEEIKLPNIPESENYLEKIKKSHKNIEDIQKTINSIVDGIKDEFEKKIRNNNFQVDKFINKLFSISKKIPYDEKTINCAITRFKLGNPPGKKRSYGDALIWESLLKDFPKGEDLFFVGFDKDFKSVLDDNDFSPYLLNEWKSIKESNIITYKQLGIFIREQLPSIKISEDMVEKENKINQEYLLSNDAITKALLKMMAKNQLTEIAQKTMKEFAEKIQLLTIPQFTDEQLQILKNASKMNELLSLTMPKINSEQIENMIKTMKLSPLETKENKKDKKENDEE